MDKPYRLIVKEENQYDLDEIDYIGTPLTAKEVDEQLSAITGGLYRVPITTLRWYQNIGLIEKPTRKGRIAMYAYSTYMELLGIRTIREYFGLKIERLVDLKQSAESLYTIAYVLQQIESQFLTSTAAPKLEKYLKALSLGLTESENLEEIRIHKVNIGLILAMKSEWKQLPGLIVHKKNITIPMIREDYFTMVQEGIEPLKIVIETNEA